MNSFPNHIKDQIYLYIWLNAIGKVNTEYHAKFYLDREDMLFYRNDEPLPAACNWRHLQNDDNFTHLFKATYRETFSITSYEGIRFKATGILPKNYF